MKKLERVRWWHEYIWTTHALQRIAEYKFALHRVFEDFNCALEMKKTDEDLRKQVAFHGGVKAIQTCAMLANEGIIFIVDMSTRRVITVISSHRFTQRIRNIVEGKWKVVEVNGVKRMMNTKQYEKYLSKIPTSC